MPTTFEFAIRTKQKAAKPVCQCLQMWLNKLYHQKFVGPLNLKKARKAQKKTKIMFSPIKVTIPGSVLSKLRESQIVTPGMSANPQFELRPNGELVYMSDSKEFVMSKVCPLLVFAHGIVAFNHKKQHS
jgi:hypothetical protein